MGTRLVFSDGEWIASELELPDVELRMSERRVIPASRKGKRIVVNPDHVVYAEQWDHPQAE